MLQAVSRKQGVPGVLLAGCMPKKPDFFAFFSQTLTVHLQSVGTVLDARYTAMNKTQDVYRSCILVMGRETINKQKGKWDYVLKWDNCLEENKAKEGNRVFLCAWEKEKMDFKPDDQRTLGFLSKPLWKWSFYWGGKRSLSGRWKKIPGFQCI